jgi:hypothetical protein
VPPPEDDPELDDEPDELDELVDPELELEPDDDPELLLPDTNVHNDVVVGFQPVAL